MTAGVRHQRRPEIDHERLERVLVDHELVVSRWGLELPPGAAAALIVGVYPSALDAAHGRRGTYVNGCRCRACSEANADYQQGRRGVLRQGPYRARRRRASEPVVP